MANANAKAPLETDKEKREIQRTLGKSATVIDSPAPRLKDLSPAIDAKNPSIVHFSAHGGPSNGIILLDDNDRETEISKKAIDQLFAVTKTVRLVVLSSCFSAVQAESLKEHVECVVGVSGNIPVGSALRYSLAFYEAIGLRLSVSQAHQRATILMFEDHLQPELRPQLFHRPEIDPAGIFLLARPKPRQSRKAAAASQPAIDAREARFTELAERYSIQADSYSVTKLCNNDGSSELIYEVAGLRVEDSSSVNGLAFGLKTPAGLVNAPIVDARAEEWGIHWEPDPEPEVREFEDVVNRVRRIKGKFAFRRALRKGRGPYTFGWTIRVVNMDALTVWEYENLYIVDEHRRHIDNSKLDPPKEFFARIVWLPVRSMVSRLQLPAGFPAPALQYFELDGNPEIPREEILSGGLLWSFPPPSPWKERHAHWNANFDAAKAESAGLKTQGAGSELAVAFPVMGSYYSLDWKLLNPPITGASLRLVKEAELVRKRLLEHRERRIQGISNAVSTRITETLRGLHGKLRDQFQAFAPEERFETSLMTYSDARSRIVAADALLNDGDPNRYAWDFSLPFGLGLAGACFRAGNGGFTYTRSRDARDPLKPEVYLEIPGSDAHEYVIALPIDHPGFAASRLPGDFQRCRQLIGVITVSSTSATSGMLEYCSLPADDAEKLALQDRLAAIRELCQQECDHIARLLLENAAKAQPSR